MDDKITCAVCLKKYQSLSTTHLRKHNLDFKLYRALYPDAPFKSKSTLLKTKQTLNNMISKYGQVEGTERWVNYCNKQSYTNTFEYKHKKHGWTQEQYDTYNQSRSSSKVNFIKRYGVIEGNNKWEDYVELQRYSGSCEKYFIDKYGESIGQRKWKDSCSKKGSTLDNFITRHGDVIGKQKYEAYINKRSKRMFHSKISQELFMNISDHSDKVYFATSKHGEFSIFDSDNHCIRFYDYVDSNKKKCIEFNGDIFHANPLFYTADSRPNFYNKNITASEIWENDKSKIELIKSRGFDVLIIWENEYNNNPQMITKRCKDFIYNE